VVVGAGEAHTTAPRRLLMTTVVLIFARQRSCSTGQHPTCQALLQSALVLSARVTATVPFAQRAATVVELDRAAIATRSPRSVLPNPKKPTKIALTQYGPAILTPQRCNAGDFSRSSDAASTCAAATRAIALSKGSPPSLWPYPGCAHHGLFRVSPGFSGFLPFFRHVSPGYSPGFFWFWPG
jgi:hypothetical protein